MIKTETITAKQIYSEFLTACDDVKAINPQVLEQVGFGKLAKLNMYRQNYPLHKIITKDRIKVICEKYSLIMANISNFVGHIPEKNLNDIINFKKNWWKPFTYRDQRFATKALAKEASKKDNFFKRESVENRSWYNGFYICAPAEQFQLGNSQLKDGFMIVDDPIVLFTEYDNDQIYAVITGWGLEAKEVANENMN